MEIANVILAVGGDKGHLVPKRGVTAAEIAVLMSIHGADSVFDIESVGEIERGSREERARLRERYGKAEDGDGNRIVDVLFPGAASAVFQRIEELEIPSHLMRGEEAFIPPAQSEERKPVVRKAPKVLTKARHRAVTNPAIDDEISDVDEVPDLSEVVAADVID